MSHTTVAPSVARIVSPGRVRFIMRRIAALVLVTLAAGPAAAHPLPNFRFDRTVHVRVSSTGIVVKYMLQVNAWTMVFDSRGLLSREDEVRIGGRDREFAKTYCEKKAPLIADNLRATIGNQDVNFRVEKITAEPDREHLKFQFTFRGDWPSSGKPRVMEFLDQNFEDRSGVLTLTLDRDGDAELDEVVEPIDLRGRSPLDWKPGDEVRSRKVSAVLIPPKGVIPPAAPVEPPVVPSGPAVAEVIAPPKPGLIADVSARGMRALLDSDDALWFVMLVACGFGTVHAFTPGHGKALAATYLVGERGTLFHAFLLGASTTATHTGSVIILAVVIQQYYPKGPPADVQGALQVVGGAIIFAVGTWLLIRRAMGKSDHTFGGAACGCGQVPEFGEPGVGELHGAFGRPSATAKYKVVCAKPGEVLRPAWWRVVLFGIGGGIVPCWEAVLWLFVSLSAGRIGFALPILLAFSVGLGGVLVALGAAVVLAHRAGLAGFGEQKWFRFLPVASAAVLAGVGLWLGRDGVRQMASETSPPADVRGP